MLVKNVKNLEILVKGRFGNFKNNVIKNKTFPFPAYSLICSAINPPNTYNIFFIIQRLWIYTDNHTNAAKSLKEIFENKCQLTVAIRHVRVRPKTTSFKCETKLNPKQERTLTD